MPKIIKTAKLLAQICGGWWSAMSGAASVPFAFIALFSDGTHQKQIFAILAYVALWVLVFGIGLKNYHIQLQLDDRASRKKIKDSLASCRMTIQNLCGQLNGIPYFKYYDETRQKFERDYLDVENSTFQFLNNKVGHSEAISFIDDQRIPKVILEQNAYFDMPVFKDRWIAHSFMLNRLKFREEQIEKAEAKLDSKDFILIVDNSNDLL